MQSGFGALFFSILFSIHFPVEKRVRPVDADLFIGRLRTAAAQRRERDVRRAGARVGPDRAG